jgi:hypothetical protein
MDPKYFIADAQTKIPLVENLYFCDQAATIIGTKKAWMLNQIRIKNESIYSETFKKPVLLVPYRSNPFPINRQYKYQDF